MRLQQKITTAHKPLCTCIICKAPIFRANHVDKYKERRSPKALTCGRPCSKAYNRLPRAIMQQVKQGIYKGRISTGRFINNKLFIK